MKTLRGAVWGGALLVIVIGAAPVQAAWDNVFQISCWFRHRRQAAPAVSYYVPPAPNTCYAPPPQPCCTTCYVQRCYYQPVTTYQTKSYYEPVTTYRTSYYYEPVVSYRYSSYYDPSTCSYMQMACPQTCYKLRAQSCPVQSWVQRCCQVPVTTYQRSFYWEPVTTCTPASYAPAPVASAAPADCGAVPAAPGYGTLPPAPPGVTEQRGLAAPGVTETPGSRLPNNGFQRSYQRYGEPMPNAGPSSYQQPAPSDTPWRAPASPPPPRVRLDRIVLNDDVDQPNAAKLAKR